MADFIGADNILMAAGWRMRKSPAQPGIRRDSEERKKEEEMERRSDEVILSSNFHADRSGKSKGDS